MVESLPGKWPLSLKASGLGLELVWSASLEQARLEEEDETSTASGSLSAQKSDSEEIKKSNVLRTLSAELLLE